MIPENEPAEKGPKHLNPIVLFWTTTGLATLLAAVLGALLAGFIQIGPNKDSNISGDASTSPLASPTPPSATERGTPSPTVDSSALPTTESPPNDAAHPVRRSGNLTLPDGFADLDSKSVDWDVTDSSFGQFEGDLYNPNGTALTTDLESSEMAPIDGGPASYGRCAAETGYVKKLDELNVGQQICVHTNQDRVALVRVVKFTASDRSHPYALIKLAVTVWEL